MVQLYRDIVDTSNNQIVEENVLVDFPLLESDSRTAINKALKAQTIPAKKGFLEYIYYNTKEYEKAKQTTNPGEMK